MAYKIVRYSQFGSLNSNGQSLRSLLETYIDFKNVLGQVDLIGSITWSNLNSMRQDD